MANIRTYVQETANELLYKVSWPTWKELQNSSVIVLVTSVLIAMIIFLMDYTFGANPGDPFWKGVLGYFYSIIQ